MIHPSRSPLAVALLSGGLDSAVAAAWVLSEGHEVHALSVDYGQRHRAELDAAAAVAQALGLASHRIVRVDLASFGGSALTGGGAVPKDRSAAEIGRGVPSTYVPARNTVFLSLALALAETIGAEELVIGANAIDYSGYPDCREPFLVAFERLAGVATAAGTERGVRFRVRAPLLHLGKGDIVRRGRELGVPFEATLSCYDPAASPAGPLACGACDACLLRRRGFEEAGALDPTRYAGAPS